MFLHILLNTSKICKNWKVLIPASWRNELLINVSDLYIRFCLCQINLLCSSAKTGFLIHRKRWQNTRKYQHQKQKTPIKFPRSHTIPGFIFTPNLWKDEDDNMRMYHSLKLNLSKKNKKNYPYYAHSSINALHKGKIYSNTKLMSRKTSLNLNTEKKCPCASTRGRKVSRLQSANSKYELIKSINLSH